MSLKKRLSILILTALSSFLIVVVSPAQIPSPNFEPTSIVLLKPEGHNRSFPIGSGIYLGEGIALTNWHIATNAALLILEGIDFKNEDQLLNYQIGSSNNSRINDWVCPGKPNPNSSNPEQQEYKISPTNIDKCIPYNLTQWQVFRPSKPNLLVALPEIPIKQLLFLDRNLEVAVVKLDTQKFGRIKISPPCLETAPIKLGEKLIIQSHPYGHYPAIKVIATVKDHKPSLRIDPDPRVPVKNRYAAMSIIATLPPGEGESVGPGSSGGPVFNQEGKLVGLVWTGQDLPDGTKEVWITPASVWLPQLQQAKLPDNDLNKVLTQSCPVRA